MGSSTPTEPLYNADESLGCLSSPDRPDAATTILLLGDDGAALRAVMRSLAELGGCDLETVGVAAGLERLAAGPAPDLVMMISPAPPSAVVASDAPAADELSWLVSEVAARVPQSWRVLLAPAVPAPPSLERLLAAGLDDVVAPGADPGALRLGLERWRRTTALGGQKTRLEKVVERQARNARALVGRMHTAAELTANLSRHSNLADLGRRVLEELAQVLGASGGSFYLRIGNDFLQCIHSLDPGHAPRQLRLPLPEGSPFARAMKTGQAVFLDGSDLADRVSPSGWDGYRDGSLLVFPLRDPAGGVQALIALHNKSAPPFTHEDRDLGQILAAFSAETIRTAHALEDLRASEERFRTLVETAPDAIFLKDLEGRYVHVNPKMAEALGAPAQAIIGRRSRDLVDAEAAANIEEGDARVLAGETLTEELWLRTAGQPRAWLMTKAPLRDSSGATTGYFGMGRDVTERHRLEHLLHQSQKMEALGQLAGGVAHDFNNLLQTILVHAEFAQEYLEPDHRAHHDLEQVLRATDMAAGLTRQLLAFGRRQVLEPVDLDLNRVVTDLMRMIRRVIGENIQLEIQAGPNLGNIQADPGQVEQIVMNLCINARDAMLNGGIIAIETRNEELESDFCRLHPEAQTGPYVVLTVRDTGVGMDDATQTRIFEPFFTTKGPERGTGLGLSTVYGIVRQHNGLVLVNSAPGHGTAFDVYLPVTEPRETEPVSPRPIYQILPPGGSETILVAEDDEIVRELLATLLRRSGYNAIVASDGEEAIRLFDQHAGHIRLALVDAVMPLACGREVCEHIRAGYPELPILVCTGYGGDPAQTGFVQDLGLEVVLKPHNSADILRKIRKMLDTASQP